MSEVIIPLEEFKNLPQEDMERIYNEWKKHYSDEEIQKAWNIPNRGYYFILLTRLGLHSSNSKKEKADTYQVGIDPNIIEAIKNDIDAVFPYEIFKNIDEELQKVTLRLWREKYSSNAIIDFWGISAAHMANVTKSLGLPALPRGRRKTFINPPIRINEKVYKLIDQEVPVQIPRMNVVKSVPSQSDSFMINPEIAATTEKPLLQFFSPSTSQLSEVELDFSIEGTFTGKQAKEHILAFSQLPEDNKVYKIKLQIIEKSN